ncbi:MAG TPA: H-NS family nucleoid-associated regulatory protein [Bordetella sp.]
MPSIPYATLLAQILKETRKLQKQVEALKCKQRKTVLTSIIKSMREFGVSPEEIIEAYEKQKRY